MTSGGPANATQITSTYTLLQAYANLDFGYAAALSVVWRMDHGCLEVAERAGG